MSREHLFIADFEWATYRFLRVDGRLFVTDWFVLWALDFLGDRSMWPRGHDEATDDHWLKYRLCEHGWAYDGDSKPEADTIAKARGSLTPEGTEVEPTGWSGLSTLHGGPGMWVALWLRDGNPVYVNDDLTADLADERYESLRFLQADDDANICVVDGGDPVGSFMPLQTDTVHVPEVPA